MIADRGYDVDWFRDALKDKGMRPCIPGRKTRDKPVRYDKRSYKRRNRIEIMFGRLKDWRRVATRYDRCPKVFLSAIALAAADTFAFGAGSGKDRIAGFSQGADTIEIADPAGSFASLTITTQGASLVVPHDGGQISLLQEAGAVLTAADSISSDSLGYRF